MRAWRINSRSRAAAAGGAMEACPVAAAAGTITGVAGALATTLSAASPEPPARLDGDRLLFVRRPFLGEEPDLEEDQVDIHLNPKPGPDWMPRGVQKRVRTPGKNQKRYLAGALNLSTGLVVWVEDERKRSQLFIDLIDAIARRYRRCRKIHLILDNYSIHTSRITLAALERHKGRVVLHFLLPFNSDENPIEGLWRDLHANVTRNHRCRTIEQLMGEVNKLSISRQPNPTGATSRHSGPLPDVRESGTLI